MRRLAATRAAALGCFASSSKLVGQLVDERITQIDLAETVKINRVFLLPVLDDFDGIGAGFEFPVRFKVEGSDDPKFRRDVKLLWMRYNLTFMADLIHSGFWLRTNHIQNPDAPLRPYCAATIASL